MARAEPNHNLNSLNAAALERLALRYVERYATTRARLMRYLERKLHERGWNGEATPPVAALVERLAELGYVDDRQFAETKAASLTRRGYGTHRVNAALRAAGISPDDAAGARAQSINDAWEAALAFARRRHIGPFATATTSPDEAARRRAFAAMVRAGHPIDLVRRMLVDDIPDITD